MRQLTFVEPKVLEWWDVPEPRIIDDGDVLIRPLAVARCDLDLYIALGMYPLEGPFALGHETVGEVIDVGDGVASVRPGDRVIVPFQISCGRCARCVRGLTNACTSVPDRSAFGLASLSGKEHGGGLSDLLRVPFADHMLLAHPESCSIGATAGIADNVTDGFRCVEPHLRAYPQAEVLVIGGLAQSVGLYAVEAAIALGSKRVVYVDNQEGRLAMAEEMGAEIVELTLSDDLEPMGPFPITVEASGLAAGLLLATRSVDVSGVCTSVSGGLTELSPIPMREMYGRGVTFHVGRIHSRRDMPRVLEHVEAGRLHPDRIVTRTASFDDAIEAMLDGSPKVVFLNE